MRNLFKYCVIIILILFSCRNPSNNNSNAEKNESDTTAFSSKGASNKEAENTKVTDNQINKLNPLNKEAKSIEVEIIKLNPGDSTHKLSLFTADRKYFHKDSLYCELLYKLKEIQSAAREHTPDGDYISMMIDDRPQGPSQYYQIAVYRIRVKLDKVDRIDSYRIDIKTKLIEKHDVVRDKWIPVK